MEFKALIIGHLPTNRGVGNETNRAWPPVPSRQLTQGRYGQPDGCLAAMDDIPPMVVYFAGHESRFVTGQSLSIDGGATPCTS